jgi:hypothetical protein
MPSKHALTRDGFLTISLTARKTGLRVLRQSNVMYVENKVWDKNPIKHALNIAEKYQEGYTIEQRNWVIDQIVRALTECPLVVKEVATRSGNVFEISQLGESPEYLHFLKNNPDWNKGIPE